MSKQKKNIITLVVTVLLLGGLAGVYFWQSANAEAEAALEQEAAAPESESVTLIEREQAEVSHVDFLSETGTALTLTQREGEPAAEGGEAQPEWFFPEYPDMKIDQTVATDMVRGGFQLIADKKILDTVDSPADYGFSPPAMTATAHYTDGTAKDIYIGGHTPDQNRYYMMVEGDPALYLLFTYYGDRYFKTENDMVDRTLANFAAETYEYILINERGKKPIEFDFIGTQEQFDEQVASNGSAVISMTQPYHGRELYYSNFKTQIMDNLAGFQLGDLAESEAEDLTQYGLTEPSLEFWYTSGEDDLHLLFGDRTDDGKIYVKYFDRPQVFTAEYASVSVLYGINPFSVIDKFLALVNIEDCESIDVTGYHMEINHGVLPPEEGEEEGGKTIEPTLNGTPVGEDDFRELYRLVVGLAADMEVEDATLPGEPAVTVTYNMIEGEPIAVNFYEYEGNPNFYLSQREGEEYIFATNKQSVDAFFERAEALS